MLSEMLDKLMEAMDEEEKEKAFRNLERVGMDRATARMLAVELKKEGKRCN